jgi:hypothetical protein
MHVTAVPIFPSRSRSPSGKSERWSRVFCSGVASIHNRAAFVRMCSAKPSRPSTSVSSWRASLRPIVASAICSRIASRCRSYVVASIFFS